MITPSKVITAYLINAGIGTRPADREEWPVFRTTLPSDPNEAIVVYDTSGTTEGRYQRDGKVVESFGIEFRTRSKNVEEAQEKIFAIRDLMDQIKNTTITIESVIYKITSFNRNPPIPIGQDDKARHNFTMNGLVKIAIVS